MIDRGDFSGLTNKDLPVKHSKLKRKYKKISKVAKNNIKGRSIEQRRKDINSRKEKSHWEMDLVVGKERYRLQVMTERVARKELIFEIHDKKQERIKKNIDSLK